MFLLILANLILESNSHGKTTVAGATGVNPEIRKFFTVLSEVVEPAGIRAIEKVFVLEVLEVPAMAGI